MALQDDVTRLLNELSAGNQDALNKLLPIVYSELRRIAQGQRRRHVVGETLNTTALVHEAYLKLVRPHQVSWNNRGHFYAVAARAMRQVLVDAATHRQALKRGGGEKPLPLEEAGFIPEEQAEDVLALHEALTHLDRLSPRQAQVVELRFFGGLTIEEAAKVIGVSARTVKSDWTLARAWLSDRMKSES